MIRAHISKIGRRWSVRVAGAQGKANAKVATLGDGKRTAEALAQATLVFERHSDRHWIGREPTADERENLDRLYELARDEDGG